MRDPGEQKTIQTVSNPWSEIVRTHDEVMAIDSLMLNDSLENGFEHD